MKYKYCKSLTKFKVPGYTTIIYTMAVITKYKHGTTKNYRMCHPSHLNWILKSCTLLTQRPNCIQKNH